MDEILNDFSSRALTTAIEANLLKYYQYIGRSDNVELSDNPELTRFFTGIPHPFMNGIFCKYLTSFIKIEETLNLLKSRKVPFLWWIGSAAQSADLGTQLEAKLCFARLQTEFVGQVPPQIEFGTEVAE